MSGAGFSGGRCKSGQGSGEGGEVHSRMNAAEEEEEKEDK
jgi:hypothetical protein